ncbi:MAG TPA: hypothetical protein VLF91_02015 [Candidatus Saccharimonadales bacterium]|nr:hypothetical protein [Candidatus Saccharimonadales bacterium]
MAAAVLSPAIPFEDWNVSPTQEWVDADIVPELRAARLLASAQAQDILAERLALLCDGKDEDVPYAVDPLTTAARAITARTIYGPESQAAADAYQSLVVDCSRLLAEAMRKGTWELFPETKQTYDPQSGSYTFMGRDLLEMVRDGITPITYEEEQLYRAHEYVEEATFSALRRLGHLAIGNLVVLQPGVPAPAGTRPDTRIITISECADWAINAHNRGSKVGYGGYVPEIQKLMIRGIRYGEDDSRYQEQLGLPGTYITHDVVVQALQVLGLSGQEERPSKKEVRGKQFITASGQDVLYIAALLDELASEASGQLIFMGEAVPANHPRDYGTIRAEAEARQAVLETTAYQLADFLLKLEDSGSDHWAALGIVEQQVKKMVFSIVRTNPAAAQVAFDVPTAERLTAAWEARVRGDQAAAERLEHEAEQNAPAVAYCGAGSCGLVEAEGPMANDMKAKLNFKSGDSMLRDKERSCIKCGKKGGVFYVFNATKVNKGCTCGATSFSKEQ